MPGRYLLGGNGKSAIYFVFFSSFLVKKTMAVPQALPPRIVSETHVRDNWNGDVEHKFEEEDRIENILEKIAASAARKKK